MKTLITLSSILAAGTLAVNAATLTYVGGYDSFKAGTSVAGKLLETDTAGSNLLSGTFTGTEDTLTVPSSLTLSNAKDALGTIAGTDNSNDGFLFVMTFSSITNQKQTLLSTQCVGYGINFVLTPGSSGLSDASLSMYWSGSSTTAGTEYKIINSGDFSASVETPLTIAFGFQRNDDVKIFADMGTSLLTNTSTQFGGNMGTQSSSTSYADAGVVLGARSVINSTSAPDGSFVLNNFYAYTLSGSAITSAQVSDLISAANLRAIPEPSAFGLLAGIGALALAGTRRRRKVK